MASALEKKQIDEFLARYQASAVRKQRRVEELEQQNKHLLGQISSSLIVPTCAFGMSYARAYYGDEASAVCGLPIDAAGGLLLKAFATLLDLSSDNGAQTAAKFMHDVANGSLASWSSKLGAELGAKKRMERPALSAPSTIAEEMPARAARPVSHEELDEMIAAMQSKVPPPIPERAPAPLPPPMQQKTNPLPTAEPVAAKFPAPAAAAQSAAPSRASLNDQATPIGASAKSAVGPIAPSVPDELNRVTKSWVLDPEAEMRALLQSRGAPADPKTVAYALTHKNSIEAYRQIVGRARTPESAPPIAKQTSRATKPWVLDPEAEMRVLLQSHGMPTDSKTVEYVLMHENAIEAFRAIIGGAQVPTTKPVVAKAPAPESPLNAPPTSKKRTRRSLGARTQGIMEAVGEPSLQMPIVPNAAEPPKQLVPESNHSGQLSQEELDAAKRWRRLTAA